MDDVSYGLIGIIIVLFSLPIAVAIESVPITTDFTLLALSRMRISLYTMIMVLTGLTIANIPWIRGVLIRG